jgi:4-amino-4-deoxy-L-arabinose transferase-like glycosyltransferase
MRGHLCLLLVGFAALTLPQLGAAPLERAEIYFMDGARSMVESGDWLVPSYRGEPFFDKPALTYWLIAFSFLWLGPTPGAARLVPALVALGVLAATVWLGRILFDRRSALAGGIVLATTIVFLSFARVAMSDMLLTLWSTLAAALIFRLLSPATPSWTAPALGLVLGLGFQTKGPISLLLPALAVLSLTAQGRRLRPRLAWSALAGAILLFGVVGLGWFVLVLRRLGPAPLEYFFLRENLQRFAGEAYDVGRPFWFYLPTYAGEGLPWSPLLAVAVRRALRPAPDVSGAPAARFLAGWAALMVLLLSLSRGKMDYYLLPAYPALSLLVGWLLAAVPWGPVERRWARFALLVAAAALAVLAAGCTLAPALPWLPDLGPRLLLATVALAGAVVCLAVHRTPLPSRLVIALAGSSAAVALVVVGFFVPAFTAAQPNQAIAAQVGRERLFRRDAQVALCSDPSRAQRDILFHARVSVVERCDLWSLAASPSPFLFLLQPDEYASFRNLAGFREVGRHSYLPATAFSLSGLLSLPTPGHVVLAANYKTADPEAERKRRKDYRRELQSESESESEAEAEPSPVNGRCREGRERRGAARGPREPGGPASRRSCPCSGGPSSG